MSVSPSISPALRQEVLERAEGCCEYCLSRQDLSVATFHIDHIRPLAKGGRTEIDNLALACPSCNGAKGARIGVKDPQTIRWIPLFHPRRQRWSRHFRWNRDFSQIIGHTVCGRATVEVLEMNRPRLVQMRRHWRILGLHPPVRLIVLPPESSYQLPLADLDE